MVHEMIGIDNNRVSLGHVQNIKKELEEVVLSSDQDDFFRQHQYTSFGDLGTQLKGLVDEFQVTHRSNENIETLEDMQRFIEAYPEFRKLRSSVEKHTFLIGELSRMVGEAEMMEVSEAEQDLACSDDYSGSVKALDRVFSNPKVQQKNLINLVALFGLRHCAFSAKAGRLDQFDSYIQRLKVKGMSSTQEQLLRDLLQYPFSNAFLKGGVPGGSRGAVGLLSAAKEHIKVSRQLSTMPRRVLEHELEFAHTLL
mmetsp:Transcript_8738/g.23599  ORF Transcript_8738/g.23599 Transcript_8738/m.23599 type:complete len:254 (-) Transcript_8738:1620-2381(-)